MERVVVNEHEAQDLAEDLIREGFDARAQQDDIMCRGRFVKSDEWVVVTPHAVIRDTGV